MMDDTTRVELPYFDQILAHFETSPDSPLSQAMQRHVHWGLFSSSAVEPTLANSLAATEAMTEKVCQAGRVANGLRILDVGCGFGGTIAHLNERLSGCRLVGLNIDERQLARARQLVHARPGNTVEFVQGDACELPFEDRSFDVVLAVECIFHFPSRRRFFSEVRRILHPGGTVALSDFVVDSEKIDEMGEWTEANAASSSNFYGVKSAALCTGTYDRVARSTGFTVLSDEDVTAATMPTYPGLKTLLASAGFSDGVKATAYLEELSRRGFFQYRILSFEATGRG
jgi:ubiquinone/menaquinone biosynthesis C-methylase UbiE